MVKDKRYLDKEYWHINISGRDNMSKFFAYIEKGDKQSTELVKKEFPWKFDHDLTKEEVLNNRRVDGDKLVFMYEKRYSKEEIL